jgi:ubiquinone/menaquinone biosynthesis C-methylase UbiE
LSDRYIETAVRLSRLLNMQERVNFHAGSALALPFDDHTFDGAWSLQMNMNIDDKLSWLMEIYRVMKPGGRLVLYEVCGNRNTPVYFPVTWAQDSSMSFLVPPEAFRNLIASVGFDIAVWNDRTDLAQEEFSQVTEPVGEPELPILGSYLLVGRDIKTKAFNLRRNLDEERVSLIEAVVVKPGN